MLIRTTTITKFVEVWLTYIFGAKNISVQIIDKSGKKKIREITPINPIMMNNIPMIRMVSVSIIIHHHLT